MPTTKAENDWPDDAADQVGQSAGGNFQSAASITASSAGSSNKVRRGASKKELVKYDEHTKCGAFASTSQFEYSTLFVIFVNAIWLGVDTDLNHAESVHDTDIGFLVVEHFFCVYFTAEILIRFFAIKVKRDCLRDGWFVFDSLLVTLMITETWVLPLVLPKGQDNPLDKLGALRLLRLLRLSRLIRLMRSLPELLTIVKGIIAATRSVASVLLFLTILDYVFAIVFTGTYQKEKNAEADPEACDKWEEGGPEFAKGCLSEVFFGDLGLSMFTLLCNGTLLDDVAGLVKAIREDNIIMLGLFFLFIVLSSFTVLNMLIGILCEVVEKTGAEETDKLRRETVKDVITAAFETIDKDGSDSISRKEFNAMCEDGVVLHTLERDLGIDSSRLVEMRELLFTNSHGERVLGFEAFLKLLIRLRPEEQASTMDVQQFRKLIREQSKSMSRHMDKLYDQVQVCKKIASGGTLLGRTGPPGDDQDGKKGSVADVSAAPPVIGADAHARLVAEATDAELMEEMRRRF